MRRDNALAPGHALHHVIVERSRAHCQLIFVLLLAEKALLLFGNICPVQSKCQSPRLFASVTSFWPFRSWDLPFADDLFLWRYRFQNAFLTSRHRGTINWKFPLLLCAHSRARIGSNISFYDRQKELRKVSEWRCPSNAKHNKFDRFVYFYRSQCEWNEVKLWWFEQWQRRAQRTKKKPVSQATRTDTAKPERTRSIPLESVRLEISISIVSAQLSRCDTSASRNGKRALDRAQSTSHQCDCGARCFDVTPPG